jgi:hypothetical protein
MPVGLAWLVEGHLVLAKGWHALRSDELADFDARVISMLESANRPLVHGIHDYSEALAMPPIKDLVQLKSGRHPKIGWVIVVGLHDRMMKFFVSIALQIFGVRVRFMDSVQEALSFLQDIDSTLPDLTRIDLELANRKAYEQIKDQIKLPTDGTSSR